MNSELEIRVLKNLHTHLSPSRDLAETLGRISDAIISIGRRLDAIEFESSRDRVTAIEGFLEFSLSTSSS